MTVTADQVHAAMVAEGITRVLAEAERLLKDITPGEWCISEHDGAIISFDDPNNPYPTRIAETDDSRNDDFIAASPRLVRELLTALRSLPPQNE